MVFRISVEYVGGGIGQFDQGMLQGGFLQFVITDVKGVRLRYLGDDLEFFVPLEPDKPVRLANGFYFGVTRPITLRLPPKGTVFVQAFVDYRDPRHNGNIWTGRLTSKRISVK